MAARKLRTVRIEGMDPLEAEAIAEGQDGQAARGTPASRRKRDGASTVRYTFDLSEELDFRVTGIAKYRRLRKKALLLEMIEGGCAKYKIDGALKAAWAESQRKEAPAA